MSCVSSKYIFIYFTRNLKSKAVDALILVVPSWIEFIISCFLKMAFSFCRMIRLNRWLRDCCRLEGSVAKCSSAQ